MSYRVFFLEFISGDFTVDLGGPGLQGSQVQLPLALYDTAELPLQPSVTEDKEMCMYPSIHNVGSCQLFNAHFKSIYV